MMTALTMRAATAMLCMVANPALVHAQVQANQPLPEDLAPRVIGAAGTTMLGFSGYADRFFSAERLFPTNYTVQVDAGRFITGNLVARGGLAGTGVWGGEDQDDLATGSGAPALHAFGGLLYYLTPQSMWSVYSGGEYWAQITQRADADAGSLVGKLGMQGAVSSRVGIFIEGGYGIALTRGDEGERVWRFVGQIGLRLKL